MFFKVSNKSTKPQIKQAIEKLFNVKVLSVNTLNQNGKLKNLEILQVNDLILKSIRQTC